MTYPNPQDPDSVLYQFVDQQPLSAYPNNPDSSASNYTVTQFTPTNITNTWPVIVTKMAHGLQNGNKLMATKFISFPIALATGMEQLNNRSFYVCNVTVDTFELCDANQMGIDGRNYTPYVSGGQFTVAGNLVVNPSEFPPPGFV